MAAMRKHSVMPPPLRQVGLQDGDDASSMTAVELESRVVVLARGERRAAETPALAVAAVVMGGKGSSSQPTFSSSSAGISRRTSSSEQPMFASVRMTSRSPNALRTA